MGTNNTNIAERIKKYRKYNFLTQKALAEILDVKPYIISKVEHNEKELPSEALNWFIQLEAANKHAVIKWAFKVVFKTIKKYILFWKH